MRALHADDEQVNYLVWCLTEKANEYYALVHEQKGQLTFENLVSKMATRFGQHELPAAA